MQCALDDARVLGGGRRHLLDPETSRASWPTRPRWGPTRTEAPARGPAKMPEQTIPCRGCFSGRVLPKPPAAGLTRFDCDRGTHALVPPKGAHGIRRWI
ncbi:hypothetical protein MUK42_35409 [Musa troglodytarum]|uniref:Uncharacterized protein n=1 Tax=Musa troglodytarum TaxID=320322 RepID=A0A9E7E9M8_9LILI|nr:hypothetical protein MUK42_35409 [Musa troglodytarum]